MNQNNKLRLIGVLLAVMLLLVGVAIGTIVNNKDSCEANPLVYGVERLEDLNNVNFTCACYSNDYSLKPFYFNDEGLYKENPSSQVPLVK